MTWLTQCVTYNSVTKPQLFKLFILSSLILLICFLLLCLPFHEMNIWLKKKYKMHEGISFGLILNMVTWNLFCTVTYNWLSREIFKWDYQIMWKPLPNNKTQITTTWKDLKMHGITHCTLIFHTIRSRNFQVWFTRLRLLFTRIMSSTFIL